MKPVHVQLHKPLFVPGIGDLNKKTLNQQFFPGIEFEMHEYGVIAKWKHTAFLIPWVNVEVAVLDGSPQAVSKSQQKRIEVMSNASKA
jgi:hypothetical protein